MQTNFNKNISIHLSKYQTKDLPFHWTKEAIKVLKDPDVSPRVLLDTLSQHPLLKECFSKDAGVSEGYTVGQHTKMVLKVAQKYRDVFLNQVTKLVYWDEFLLFLALHDIGKGIAKENETEGFSTSISFKKAELKTTRQILSRIMKQLNISDEKTCLFYEMLSYDSQGLYLKGDIDVDEIFDNILEMATNCKTNPEDFYQIFKIFHIVDAASYPSLQSIFDFDKSTIRHNETNQKKISALFKKLTFVQLGERAYNELIRKVKKQDNPEKLKKEFLDQLPKLQMFLEKKHKELLLLTDKDSLHLEKEKFRKIKIGFRDIFVYFAKNTNNIKKLKTRYNHFIDNSCGRRDFSYVEHFGFNLFFGDVIKGSNQTIELITFVDELINFRKDYLCRYSLQKVSQYIKDIIQSIKKEEFIECRSYPIKTMIKNVRKSNCNISNFTLSLLKTTFIHGSNSAILPNLLKTGMYLMPSGRLFRNGVIPFSGELKNGASITGINQYKISGTSLDDGVWAHSYAVREAFHTKKIQEVERVERFLKDIEKKKGSMFNIEYDTTDSAYWVRISAAILRLRILDPLQYKKFENRLKKAIDNMDQDFNKFKGYGCYKDRMPKKEDPDGKLGYGWHDYYWWIHFRRTEGVIESLKKAVKDNIVKPKGITKAIQNPYGLVFGSRTIHADTPSWTSSERCAQKSALLGKDIQFIFLSKKNKEHMKCFLHEQGLLKSIKLIDVEELSNAILLNQLASPYIADFASRKKLGGFTKN